MRPGRPGRAAPPHRHDPGDDGAAAAAASCWTCCSPSTSRLSLMVLLVGGLHACGRWTSRCFPTVLLVTTLLRLALNVASTRVVLLEGHTGAGRRRQGDRGLRPFRGRRQLRRRPGRVRDPGHHQLRGRHQGRRAHRPRSSARFTLDAMPGKQMAIDADLNAGLIDRGRSQRAGAPRSAQEADFYGSMDGASKFVRGDAIAGILILFINIVGGLVDRHAAARPDRRPRPRDIYTLLTIGDGLVAQIPALLLSTAAAIIVTRVVQRAGHRAADHRTRCSARPQALAVTGRRSSACWA
ncbi:MAG: flagellar biosynthesis protein FlhA [Comamonadaceae bacterium]|nr:flagellar biosynthesis protein FlhA [Comamonadaceae bacterium]